MLLTVIEVIETSMREKCTKPEVDSVGTNLKLMLEMLSFEHMAGKFNPYSFPEEIWKNK